MIFNYIVWSVKPDAFSIGDHQFRWYGILLAAGFYLGFFILRQILKKEKFIDDRINILALYIFAGTIIGLRLGHCLFYEPLYYLKNPIEIFKVWEGGLASHGAAVGVLLAVYLYCRKFKLDYLWLLDRVVIIIPLVGAIVRIGNLINSEIFGMPTSMPWGFIFTAAGKSEPRHPTQIYESTVYILIFLVLAFLYFKREKAKFRGYIFGLFLILLFSARFFLEFLKDVQVDFERGMAVNMGQILSLPLIAVGVYIFFKSKQSLNHKI